MCDLPVAVDVCSCLLVGGKCPKCSQRSWINQGDTDFTDDVDAIRCGWCGHVFLIDEDFATIHDEEEDGPWQDIVVIKDGHKVRADSA